MYLQDILLSMRNPEVLFQQKYLILKINIQSSRVPSQADLNLFFL